MAVQRKQNFLGGMRVDTPYLRAIEEDTIKDFDTLLNGVLGSGDDNYIIRGLELDAIGLASTWGITLADSVIVSKDNSGCMYQFASVADGESAKWFPFATGTFSAGDWYVYFTLSLTDGPNYDAKFINSLTEQEIVKTVPFSKNLSRTFANPSSSVPTSGFCVAKVTIDGSGNVTASTLDGTGTKRAFGNADSLFGWIETEAVHSVTAAAPLVVAGTDVDPEIQIDTDSLTGNEVIQYDGTEWKRQKLNIQGIDTAGASANEFIMYNGSSWVTEPANFNVPAGGILGYTGSTYPDPTGLATNSSGQIPMKATTGFNVAFVSDIGHDIEIKAGTDSSGSIKLSAENIVSNAVLSYLPQYKEISSSMGAAVSIVPISSFIKVKNTTTDPDILIALKRLNPDSSIFPKQGSVVTIMNVGQVNVSILNSTQMKLSSFDPATNVFALTPYSSITFIFANFDLSPPLPYPDNWSWVEVSRSIIP